MWCVFRPLSCCSWDPLDCEKVSRLCLNFESDGILGQLEKWEKITRACFHARFNATSNAHPNYRNDHRKNPALFPPWNFVFVTCPMELSPCPHLFKELCSTACFLSPCTGTHCMANCQNKSSVAPTQPSTFVPIIATLAKKLASSAFIRGNVMNNHMAKCSRQRFFCIYVSFRQGEAAHVTFFIV